MSKARFFARRMRPLPDDLTLLSGWSDRIDACLHDIHPSNPWIGMLFRPDSLAADAMMRLSLEYSYIMQQIQSALEDAEKWLDRQAEGEQAQQILGDAISVLFQRIRSAVETIKLDQDPMIKIASMPVKTELSEADYEKLRVYLKSRGRRLVMKDPTYQSRRRRLRAILKYNDETRKRSNLGHRGSAAPGIPRSPKNCQDVRDRLERCRETGDAYSSQAKLAKAIGCSPSTVNKAFGKSPKLRAWMALTKKPKAPRAIGLSEIVTASRVQTKEPDPADMLSEEDVDAVIAKVSRLAKPAELATLKTLDAQGRRDLAKAYYASNLSTEPSPLQDDSPGLPPQKVKQHRRV